ncbi:hypothetical protein SJ05684_b47740 (plasmid) [Sinorhizobium sojae CCBAU 05684]|uniref:Uncharacterized protein n=1 Tax=Sinorhizobium sojae CCBAU 05684 TaxID=716928 RepID=A0A249PIY0_9HYPH|nr:hypothetical protein [Sinorhizobium sojae]ASY65756.1 hypothetical protein SJ05684_b47740 [Sinorhizobium sojae CCBAU 05684]
MVESVTNQNGTAPIRDEMDRLNSSSLRNEIYRGIFEGYKNKDRSFQSIDVALNRDKYTAEQKLMTLFDLLEARENYDNYDDLPKRFGEKPLNQDEIWKDLNNAIAILQADSEVQSLLTEKVFKGFKHILTTGNRVAPETETDTRKIIENSIARDDEVKDLRATLTKSFDSEVVNGGILNDGLRAGKDIQTILQEYNSALSFYLSVLPQETMTANADKIEASYKEFYNKEVLPRLPTLSDALDGLTRAKGLGSVTPQVQDHLIASEVFGEGLFDSDLMKQMAAFADGSERTVSGRAIPEVSKLDTLFQSGIYDIPSMRRLLTEKHLTRDDKPIPSLGTIAGETIDLIANNYSGARKETFESDLISLFRELWGDFVELDGGDVRGLDGAIDRFLQRNGISGEKANALRDGAKMLFNGAALASTVARDKNMSTKELSALLVMSTKLAGGHLEEAGATSGLRGEASRQMTDFKLASWDASVRKNHELDALNKAGDSLTGFIKRADPQAIVFGPALEPGGVARLFSDATSIMAENLYGGDNDKAFARQTFSSDVLTILEGLWEKFTKGEVSARDLPGHLERLTFRMNAPQGSGMGASEYREAVAQAVTALLDAGALVSRVQPKTLGQDLVYRGADGKFHRKSGINTYTPQEISALISIATGLAGRSIASGGGTYSLMRGDRPSIKSSEIAGTLFGTKDHGWDIDVLGRYDLKTAEEMAGKVTDLVKERAPDLNIGDPTAFSGDSTDMEDILGDTVNSMASSYFGDNVEAAERFKGNVMSIIYYVWSVGRPGGQAQTMTDQLLKKVVDERVTEAPGNMSLVAYKDTIVRSVNAVMYGVRTVYAGFNLKPGDNVGLSALVLYAASTGVNVVQAVSEGLKGSANASNSKLTEWAKIARQDTAELLKLGVNVANALIFTAWLPLEVIWLIQDIKGGDPVNISLLALGLGADVVIAGEAIVGAGMALANLMTRVGTLGGVGLLGSAGTFAMASSFAMVFGAANLVSTAAWMAYAIYQGVKDKNAFKKQTKELEATLKRLVDDPIKFARGFQFGPIKIGDLDKHEATPVDWDSVIARQKARATA